MTPDLDYPNKSHPGRAGRPPTGAPPMVRFVVSLPPDLHAALKAASNGKSMAEITREALREWLNNRNVSE